MQGHGNVLVAASANTEWEQWLAGSDVPVIRCEHGRLGGEAAGSWQMPMGEASPHWSIAA